MSESAPLLRKLVAIRRAGPLTAADVAARMGCQARSVHNLESKARRGGGVHTDTLVRYCRAIGVQLCYRVVNETNETQLEET